MTNARNAAFNRDQILIDWIAENVPVNTMRALAADQFDQAATETFDGLVPDMPADVRDAYGYQSGASFAWAVKVAAGRLPAALPGVVILCEEDGIDGTPIGAVLTDGTLVGHEGWTGVKLVNLTPHPITWKASQLGVIVDPSGVIARLDETDQPAYRLGLGSGYSIRRTYTAAANMPEPEDGVVYVVSQMMLGPLADAGRSDCVAPDTGSGAIRDAAGRIVGTTRWITS